MTILSEQIDGSSDQDYKKTANEVDDIINRLYFLLKDYTINNYNDIVSLIKDSSLKVMAKKI